MKMAGPCSIADRLARSIASARPRLAQCKDRVHVARLEVWNARGRASYRSGDCDRGRSAGGRQHGRIQDPPFVVISPADSSAGRATSME